MTELQIIITENLKFTVHCKNAEVNSVLSKVLKNFADKDSEVICRYWCEEELWFDSMSLKEALFDNEIGFYANNKSLKIFKSENLTDEELKILTT
jgi:hypothetical protein